MLNTFIALAKPRIVLSNLVTIAAGFFLASQGRINWALFGKVEIAMAFVIAACVFNNVIDRDIDQLLGPRTQKRALVQKILSPSTALIYACVLAVIGFALLFSLLPLLAALFGLLGFFVYVVVYSLWMKRHSVHAILVGSIAGACPPVVGYCAVTNRFDLAAAILFLILSFWQMPHSYALGILGMNEYKQAGIPVLPLKKGLRATKIQITAYLIAFIGASCLLTLTGYTGIIYLVITLAIGTFWLRLALLGFYTSDDRRWARKMLSTSIIAIFILSIAMALDFQG